MARQVAATDPDERRELFDRVQHILGTHTPAIYLAAPRVVVAMSSRVRNAAPAVMQPQVLWNAERLTVN